MAHVHKTGPLHQAQEAACLALEIHPATEGAYKLRPDELEMVLAHELAHVRRFDNFTLRFHRLVTAILFSHPVVWLCRRMLQRQAELALLKQHLEGRVLIMNVFAAIESDLAQRIRRTLAGGAPGMNTRSRVIGTLLLLATCAVTLPSAGVAQSRDAPADGTKTDVSRADAESSDDGVDWDVIKETAPEDWTDEQKAQVEAAGYDLQAIAKRVRHYQQEQAKRLDHDGNIDRDGDHDRLALFQRKVIRAAMAAPPEGWSERLKAAIVEAGWDLDKFTEGVRQRQALADSGGRGDGDGDGDDAGGPRDPAKVLAQRGEEIRAAIEAGTITAEQGRERFQAARDLLAAALGARDTDRADHDGDNGREDAGAVGGRRDALTEFQRGVAARAMATPPAAWSDKLKAAIRRAGWDVYALAARIQSAHEREAEALKLADLGLTNTAMEESSWGQLKAGVQKK